VLSNSSIILTGASRGTTNRVLLTNAGYVAVAETQYSSVKIVTNNEDNSLNLTFWNNTIRSEDAGIASDVRTGIVSLSVSAIAIYAVTDSGIVLRYKLEDDFSYKWVSHSITDITSNVLVMAQENYIYMTGESY